MPTLSSQQHSVNLVHISQFCHKRKNVTDKFWKRSQTLRIGLWNVRTLQGVARSNLLAQELAAARIPLCAITETDLPGCSCMELDDQSGYNLYVSGTADVAARGVGLIMQCDVAKSVKCFNPILDRVMRVDIMTDTGVLQENSHQILKLVERKMQGLVSSCRKPTVQTATEAENRQRVVQTIPRMYAKSYSLNATTLGFG